jgi:propionate CoA-transferase
MNIFDKFKLIYHILRWRFTWNKRNLDFFPKGVDNPKFIKPRAAAGLIPDNVTVFSCGIAGNARCSSFFWSIREHFQKTGHPQGLTWVNVAAQGGRGKVPGTIEEIAFPGLITQYISGHLDTAKALLKLGDAGKVELHTMPQGVMTQWLEARSKGEKTYRSPVGVGSFMDPRVGNGGDVTANPTRHWVEADGQALLYTLPEIEFVLFNAPYADAEGNIYVHHVASITENIHAVKAAKANGGKVMVTVSEVIPKDASRISVPSALVDYITVHPLNEQTVSVRQHRYWPMFTPESKENVYEAEEKLHFINTFLKITPVRKGADLALDRLGAHVFAQVVPHGSMVNIGVGHPEQVARCLTESGLDRNLLFTTEAGAYGGLPVPGIFFGAAINPKKLIPSTDMFRLYAEKLDTCVLGFLQVDEHGNVNSSKRGPKCIDYVGPGGFPDISTYAKTVIFVGSWMANAHYVIDGDHLTLEKPGTPKFCKEVDEITFSAEQALKRGQNVYYVTHVGVFRLTRRGLELWKVMPGIDVKKDILDACPAKIYLPEGEHEKEVPVEIVAGH